MTTDTPGVWPRARPPESGTLLRRVESSVPVARWLWRIEASGALGIGLLVAAAGWVLDQATKAAAVAVLTETNLVDVPGPVYFSLTFNSGAAFGIPAPWWLFLIVTAAVAVLVVRVLPRSQSALEPFAYGLLLAGALGNITDRLLRPSGGFGRGEVVDFIATSRVDLPVIGPFQFPTFNVADSCITVGFGLLVVAAIRHEQMGGNERQDPPATDRAGPTGQRSTT